MQLTRTKPLFPAPKNGVNSGVVRIHQRAALPLVPDLPRDTLTYTFSTGQLSGGSLSGWTIGIPAANGNPCYEIFAAVSSRNDTCTIVPSAWQGPSIILEDGPAGRSVTGQQDYYLATTMAIGVTRNTDAGSWTTNYQLGSEEKPYVWRYTKTTFSSGDPTYTDCELIFSYNAGANRNLLEQTNFSSLLAMDKWTGKSRTVFLDETLIETSFEHITTGLHGRNAYFDRTQMSASQIQYREVLQQPLNISGGTQKLEPSTWYTLSFYAKGIGVSTYVYPNCFDNSTICYVDGVQRTGMASDARIDWTLTGSWVRHTFTFKTKSSIGSANQYLLFRLFPEAFTTGYSVVPKNVYICMPKLEVGMQATSYLSNEESTRFGQPRRRRWAPNTEYFCGAIDEQYDDVVLVGEKGFYHCIKSHISSDDSKPGRTDDLSWRQYWTEAGSAMYDFLSTDIFFAQKAFVNNLIATLIQTGYSGTPHIEAEGSEFKIFGKGQYPAIVLAVETWADDNKPHAVLRFYDEYTGEFLYDLGPGGIMKNFSQVNDSYTTKKLHRLTNVTRVSELMDITEDQCSTYYRFNEGYKQIESGDSTIREYSVSHTSTPSDKNSCYFTSPSYNGTMISDGWYCMPNNGIYMMMLTDGDTAIYTSVIYHFVSGKLTESYTVMFLSEVKSEMLDSVGCDEDGDELNTSTYPYLYSYPQSL